MQFIELTYLDGIKVYLNMAHVVAFETDPKLGEHTHVVTNVTGINVKETLYEILSRLKA